MMRRGVSIEKDVDNLELLLATIVRTVCFAPEYPVEAGETPCPGLQLVILT